MISYFSGFLRALEDKYNTDKGGEDATTNLFLSELLQRYNDPDYTFIGQINNFIRETMMSRMLLYGRQHELQPFSASRDQTKLMCNALREAYVKDDVKWKDASEKIFVLLLQFWAASRAGEVGIAQVLEAKFDDIYH